MKKKRSRYFTPPQGRSPYFPRSAPPAFCPRCAVALQQRSGRFGPFLGCPRFPRCRFTFDLSGGRQQPEGGPKKLAIRLEMESDDTVRVWSSQGPSQQRRLREVLDGVIAPPPLHCEPRPDWCPRAAREREGGVWPLAQHEALVQQLKCSDGVRLLPVPPSTLAFFQKKEEEGEGRSRDGDACATMLACRAAGGLEGVPRVLRDALLPFQRRGVSQVLAWRGRALIADEMGLGKTVL